MSRYSIEDLLDLSDKAHQYTEQQIEQMNMNLSLRTSTPPPKPKEPLAEYIAVAGNIVWLEPEHHHNSAIMPCILSHCHRCAGTIEPRAFDHPAVILKKCDEAGPNGETMVLCCTMSSNPRPNSNHPRSLRISLTPEREGPNPFCTPNLMCLENIPGNFKQSNILNSHVYAIPLTQLTPYIDESGQYFRVRLSHGSYANLMRSVGMSPDEWVETCHLETGKPTTSNAYQDYNTSNNCNTYPEYYSYNSNTNFGSNSTIWYPYPSQQYHYSYPPYGWTVPVHG